MRPVASGAGRPADGAAAAFAQAVSGLRDGLAALRLARPELSFEDDPPPRKLAPFAAAFAATVLQADDEMGWGKLILLFGPAGQAGWAGRFRFIAYIRAELDPEIAADPLIGQVGWSWLTEALDARADGYRQPSGTVTRVVTEGFGTKQAEPVSTGFELRASWSPAAGDDATLELGGHVEAWSDALCMAAGLPPLPSGVAALRPHGTRKQP
jgi:Protein of unknown function (DUF3000)